MGAKWSDLFSLPARGSSRKLLRVSRLGGDGGLAQPGGLLLLLEGGIEAEVGLHADAEIPFGARARAALRVGEALGKGVDLLAAGGGERLGLLGEAGLHGLGRTLLLLEGLHVLGAAVAHKCERSGSNSRVPRHDCAYIWLFFDLDSTISPPGVLGTTKKEIRCRVSLVSFFSHEIRGNF